MSSHYCPEAAGLMDHMLDRRGYCEWCGQRLGAGTPKPPPSRCKSDTELAYGYFWDPDFGESPLDVY